MALPRFLLPAVLGLLTFPALQGAPQVLLVPMPSKNLQLAWGMQKPPKNYSAWLNLKTTRRAVQRYNEAHSPVAALPAPARDIWQQPWGMGTRATAFDGSHLAIASGKPLQIRSVDLVTGRNLWEAPLEKDPILEPRFVGSGLVYVTESWDMVQLDPGTGQERWRLRLDALEKYLLVNRDHPRVQISEALEELVVLASFGKSEKGPAGRITAVDLATGQVKWKADFPGGSDIAPLIWKDRVILGGTGHLAALSLADGHELWSYPPMNLPKRVEDALILGDRILFTSSQEIHAVDLEKGSEIWILPFPGDSGLFGEGDRVVFVQPRGLFRTRNLVALDTATGREVWHRTGEPAFPPWVADGRVFYSEGATVTALDLATGRKRWSRTHDGEVELPLWADRGAVYTEARLNGLPILHALRLEDGKDAWTYMLARIPEETLPLVCPTGIGFLIKDGPLVMLGRGAP
jgi:outer membrane protein assembly factor BamB